MSGEAPAEFALIDEFAEPAEEPEQEPAAESVDEESSEEGDEDIDLQSVLQLNLPPVEASPIEAPLQPAKPDPGVEQPSHHVEAVADEPAPPPAEEAASAIEAPRHRQTNPTPSTRRHGSTRPPRRASAALHVADGCRRPLLARVGGIHPPDRRAHRRRLRTAVERHRRGALGLDPDGRVAKAVATGSTWSGITLDWPVDGGGRLPVELAGLPIYDHTGKLAGYRGFGVCRDLDALTRLAAQRRYELVNVPPAPQPLSADIVQAGPASDSPAAELPDIQAVASSSTPELPASIAIETSHQTDLETPVETARNAQERPAVSPDQRTEIAGPDPGGKQRLQRTRPAIVGAARGRDQRGGDA